MGPSPHRASTARTKLVRNSTTSSQLPLIPGGEIVSIPRQSGFLVSRRSADRTSMT